MNTFHACIAGVVLLCAVALNGAVPRTMSYQGKLTNAAGQAVPDGNYPLVLRIYNAATGGTALWTEYDTVAAKGGLFTIQMGAKTALSLPFRQNYWLGITALTDAEMTPRTQLLSSAYAFRADSATFADSAAAGGIPAKHGSTHAPAGSDPIPGYVKLAGDTMTGTLKVGAATTYGIMGTGTGYGVYGVGTNSGTGYGVYGSSVTNCGVYGTGGMYGLYGAGGTYGVYGGGTNYGVYGTGVSYGVYGIGQIYGLFGSSTASSGGAGVYGNSSSSTGYGVYASNGGGGYALYAGGNAYIYGNFAVSGTKSAVVETNSGKRLLYCNESPESWFEDAGGASLVNGKAHVDLDTLFLQTVTIDAGHPMRVFVQPKGDCNGVYVVPGMTGFDVKELQGGGSSVSFDYRVMAKRKGYEDVRLNRANVPK